MSAARLWLLQTRVGKRTAAAAFRVASQLVDEKLITLDEALAIYAQPKTRGRGTARPPLREFGEDRSRARRSLSRTAASAPT